MLEQLASLAERAQQIWEAEQRADQDNGYEEGDEIEGDLSLSIEMSMRLRRTLRDENDTISATVPGLKVDVRVVP